MSTKRPTHKPSPEPQSEVWRAINAWRPDKLAAAHGGHKESPRGQEWLFPCPLCGSSRLRYNAEKQTGTCWGCSRGFSPILLIQAMEKCDDLGALEYVMDGFVGGENKIDSLGDIFGPTDKIQRRRQVRVLKHIGLPWEAVKIDPANEMFAVGRAYLNGRGVSDAEIREWDIHYCRSGRLRHYVVFPCRMNAKIVYWQARATWEPPDLPKEERKQWIKDTFYRKTLNPTIKAKTDPSPDEVLFNFDRAATQEWVVVCEGPIDAIKIGPHAVATLGKAVGTTKIDRLAMMNASLYVIYRDHSTNPKVAEEERVATATLAAELSVFGQVRIATPPMGRDAGSFTRAENELIINQSIHFKQESLTSGLIP
jgi:hypothetical protein